MKSRTLTGTLIVLSIGAVGMSTLEASAATVDLGTAGTFAVLGGQTVTNTGPTVIEGGHVGVSPGSAIVGFPPGSIVGSFTTHAADAVALQAQNDLTTAYNAAAGAALTQNLTGQDLGGMTLTPGTYFFSSSAQLTGTLTLNNLGDPDAEFIFQVGSTLTTASSAKIVTINGGVLPGCNVYWQIGSSATLGTGTEFQGHIMALTSITMDTGSSIVGGSALARNGSVTLDDVHIINCVDDGSGGGGGTPVPLPASAALGLVLLPVAWFARRRLAGARAGK